MVCARWLRFKSNRGVEGHAERIPCRAERYPFVYYFSIYHHQLDDSDLGNHSTPPTI